MTDEMTARLEELRRWRAMAPEEQDALIASGWHPAPLESDRYQTSDSPHNKVKAQRHGNDLGRDTTEVPVMPDQFRSGDTPDGGRLVGVEDDAGRAWCLECSDAEIRQAGETAFVFDLYVTTTPGTARRKCVNCGRAIGEVGG